MKKKVACIKRDIQHPELPGVETPIEMLRLGDGSWRNVLRALHQGQTASVEERFRLLYTAVVDTRTAYFESVGDFIKKGGKPC